MATPGHDPSGSGKSTGIKIDSSLIKTASSDVQQELCGLGVSVYSQEEFEAGVLHQIDREVGRRNAEQRRKFTLKEYGTVRQEISTVHVELTRLSKKIASLLSQPLCDVVLRLRELRTSQEVKRKQLQSLEAREQHLLRKLSGREEEDEDFSGPSGESTAKDVAFGIPMTGQSSEQQKLIQTGHMTPFGSSVGETVEPLSQEEGGTPANSGSSDSVGTGSPTVASSSEHVRDREKAEESVKQKQTVGIQLCSDTFDGLFSDLPLLPSAKIRTPPRLDKGKGKGKGKGKEPAKGGGAQKSSSLSAHPRASELDITLRDITRVPRSQEEEGTRVVSVESPPLEDGDTDVYHPVLEDSSDTDVSEYFTDEELGGAGRGNGKKLRDLSSDDSDEDLVIAHRRKKRKRKVNKSARQYHDDGDEELYRMRIRQYEEEESEPTEADMQFTGGLTIPGSIWHKLYRYQQTGVKWLWELHCQHAGGIVGDEMGLGKTIEMIALLAGLRVSSNLRSHVTRKLGLGPVLIICPATVMHQWVSEFHIWWPPFRVAVLHDSGTFLGDRRLLVEEIVSDNGVLITTYAGIRLYRDLLLGFRWDYLILDEGHKIRNPDAEITLSCKQFATPHRLILSGSPMQNNLRELWSLFDFVFPGKLGTLPVFLEQFSVPITLGGYATATQVQVETAYRCACVLRDTINPYLLRRLKADVKLQLPNKNEQVLFCRLTDYQREVYEDFLRSPEVESMLAGRKQVFSGLMTLRKLCNHPDLVTNDYCELRKLCNGEEGGGREDEDFATIDVSTGKRRKKQRSAAASLAAAAAVADDEESYGYWRRSGKLEVVESLLKLWKKQGHHVLLFSQSKLMLHILEVFVVSRGYSYVKMDGGTTISSRQPLIRRFNEDPSIFIFLLTTRVGGLGVNLTGANRVIIYDPDWNPSTDTQARERAWRIGQKRQVTIYRLLTAGTIEEKIYHRQIFKQFLTNRVLKDPRQRRFFKANDLYELFTLGSGDKDSSTETSAIFAGTGSEVVPKRKPRSPEKSRDRHGSEGISLVGSKRKSRDRSTGTPEKKKKKKSNDTSLLIATADKGAAEYPNELQLLSTEGSKRAESGSDTGSQPQSPQTRLGREAQSEDGSASVVASEVASGQVSDSPQPVAGRTESRPALGGPVLNGMEPGPSDPGSMSPGTEFGHLSFKKKRKHKKQKKKKTSKSGKKRSPRKHRVPVVEGEEIAGLERTGVFNPGGGDEEDSNEKQDDYIIRKLFKKTGIHSAMQHDNIMSSADPDYVLVESEAKKVAQSASKALRDSRKRCRAARLGEPTWTGQHGSAGVPKPRFGTGTKSQGSASSKQGGSSSAHFDGHVAGSGSLSTSSSVLLARMRSRNAHTLPEGASGLHRTTHSNLLQEVRDFIATRCKVDGQATTTEILGQFSSRLSPSENAVFRSMLHEICDFSRHGGEGLWFLKQDFR